MMRRDDERRAPGARDIIETVIGDIAMRRALPNVYLLNDTGGPIAWPVGASELLPPALHALVGMYFVHDTAYRGEFTELVDVAGQQMFVRIIPYRSEPVSVYAMIVEPFVLRARHTQASGELTTT